MLRRACSTACGTTAAAHIGGRGEGAEYRGCRYTEAERIINNQYLVDTVAYTTAGAERTTFADAEMAVNIRQS